MDPPSPCPPPRAPAWPWFLAGWLVASTQLAPAPPVLDEAEAAARAPYGALDPPSADPDRMSPRELRGLPAVGPGRALAIARARWERGLAGGPEAWEEVPGIGPETVRAIAGALRSGTSR